MSTKFKEGDRVKAVAPCDGKDRFIGEIGTILVAQKESIRLPYLVEFDNDVGGHSDHGGQQGHCWWCETDSLELFVEEPKPTKPILIIDETPPKEDYSNSCWYCRKGGLVDLYLSGAMGICPKCGRLCNAPHSVAPIKAFKHSKVAEPTTNEPLTTEELKSMDGQKVWCSSLINYVEKFNDKYCSWYTVDCNTEEITQEGTGRKYSFASNNNPWGYRAYRNKPIMAGG